MKLWIVWGWQTGGIRGKQAARTCPPEDAKQLSGIDRGKGARILLIWLDVWGRRYIAGLLTPPGVLLLSQRLQKKYGYITDTLP